MNYPKRHNGGSEFLIIPVPVGTFNLSDFDIERSVDHGYRGIESERKIGRVSRVGSNVDVHYGCERSGHFYSRTIHSECSLCWPVFSPHIVGMTWLVATC